VEESISSIERIIVSLRILGALLPFALKVSQLLDPGRQVLKMIYSVIFTTLIFRQHTNGLSFFDLPAADDTDNPTFSTALLVLESSILGLPNGSLPYLLSCFICFFELMMDFNLTLLPKLILSRLHNNSFLFLSPYNPLNASHAPAKFFV